MDAFVDSCYLASAFTLLRNYQRSRRNSVQYLETLLNAKTGHSVDSFPDVAAKLSAAKKHMSTIEVSINEEEIKALDHGVNVEIESAKDMILRLSGSTPMSPVAEVLVSGSNEVSERVAVHRQPRSRSPESKRRVTFSPNIRSTHVFDNQSPITQKWALSQNGAVAIKVTATFPQDTELDCLMCDQRFLKHQSLIEHLQSMHKVSVRLHDVLFSMLTTDNEADFCCITCESTFASRKLAFRHSRDDHTENYNTFIKLMAMTGCLKQYRPFFTHLDEDGADDPIAKSGLAAAACSSVLKSRRRSRLTPENNESSAKRRAPPFTSASPAHSPNPNALLSAAGPEVASTSLFNPVLKINLSALSASSGDSPARESTVKRGRGRPSTKKSLPTEQEHVITPGKRCDAVHVSDISIKVPIRNLRGRKPVRYSGNLPPVSSPLASELDSSGPSSVPVHPAACSKCKLCFQNAFELGYHQLKECIGRKPAGLTSSTHRFAMKSTRPSLDSAQQQQVKDFYTRKSGGTSFHPVLNYESPSKSGVQVNMTVAESTASSQQSLKRKLDVDDDAAEEDTEVDESPAPIKSKALSTQIQDLIAECRTKNLTVVLEAMDKTDVEKLFQSKRCLIQFDQ